IASPERERLTAQRTLKTQLPLQRRTGDSAHPSGRGDSTRSVTVAPSSPSGQVEPNAYLGGGRLAPRRHPAFRFGRARGLRPERHLKGTIKAVLAASYWGSPRARLRRLSGGVVGGRKERRTIARRPLGHPRRGLTCWRSASGAKRWRHSTKEITMEVP